jgi:hypothetical protein
VLICQPSGFFEIFCLTRIGASSNPDEPEMHFPELALDRPEGCGTVPSTC